MRVRTSIIWLAVLSACAGTASGQSPNTGQTSVVTCEDQLSGYSKRLADRIATLAKLPKEDQGAQLEALKQEVGQDVGDANTIALCLAGPQYRAQLRVLTEMKRVDKQPGAGSTVGGSTSAVSSGSIPALVGLALETGAITKSTNQNTVTYRTTPAKLIAAFAKYYGRDVPSDDRVYNTLTRLDLGLTFDTTGSSSASSSSGTTLQSFFQQLTEISARFNIINHRDVFSKYAFDQFEKLQASPESKQYLKNAGDFFDAIYKRLPPSAQSSKEQVLKPYSQRRNELAATIADGKVRTPEEIKTLLANYFADLTKDLKDDPNFKIALGKYIDAWLADSLRNKQLYDKIAKSPILTFEYAFDRSPMVMAQMTASTTTTMSPAFHPPDVHNARLIFASKFIGSSEYTLNLSSGFFSESAPGMKGQWRDVQGSAKLDIPIPEIPKVGRGTLTFSGLYMHLHQRPLGMDIKVNDVAVNQPGNIGLFQAKYSIAIGDTGVSVPLSITAANRTELIKESKVRGNFGITFDLDKLFANAKK